MTDIKYRKIVIASIFVLILWICAGCSSVSKPLTEVNHDNIENMEETKQQDIMKQYNEMISQEINIQEYISFVSENMEFISQGNASKLVLKFEELQREYLNSIEEKYIKVKNISVLHDIYNENFDLKDLVPEKVEDEEIKELLEETIKLGYKVDASEGFFYPIIDYSFYQKFTDYVTEDIKDYITIMAAESDNVPAKDAGLVISWEELLNRAFNLERFLMEHKDSAKYDEVKELYNRYVTYLLCGLDNTPLFSFEDSLMRDEVKAAYEKAIIKDSQLSRILEEYYETIKKEDYKFTDNVREYRDNLLKTALKQ